MSNLRDDINKKSYFNENEQKKAYFLNSINYSLKKSFIDKNNKSNYNNNLESFVKVTIKN